MADPDDSKEGPPPSNGEQSVTATEVSPSPSVGDRPPRNEAIKAANISDQAAEADLLGFSPYVEAIAEFLTNEETQPPLTLSIEGGWGSGKSSFMKQLQAEIERIEQRHNRPKPKMVWFNPAAYAEQILNLWFHFGVVRRC